MFMSLLLGLLSSNATKTLIGLGINKLLSHADDGITKDIASVMIEGISASKANPTTADVFVDAVALLKGN